MPEAKWKSEDRAQSHIMKGAVKASEDGEESFSTVLFCVDMYVSQQSSFQSKPQP